MRTLESWTVSKLETNNERGEHMGMKKDDDDEDDVAGFNSLESNEAKAVHATVGEGVVVV